MPWCASGPSHVSYEAKSKSIAFMGFIQQWHIMLAVFVVVDQAVEINISKSLIMATRIYSIQNKTGGNHGFFIMNIKTSYSFSSKASPTNKIQPFIYFKIPQFLVHVKWPSVVSNGSGV